MTIRIGVEFEIEATDKIPAYRDTIWFTEDEVGDFNSFVKGVRAGKNQNVNVQKQERYEAFRSAILNPPPEPDVTPEQTVVDAHARINEALQILSEVQASLPTSDTVDTVEVNEE